MYLALFNQEGTTPLKKGLGIMEETVNLIANNG